MSLNAAPAAFEPVGAAQLALELNGGSRQIRSAEAEFMPRMIGRLSPVQIVRFDQLKEEVMTRGVPVLDPKVHLKGATPELLARAMLRQPHLRPRARIQSVVGNEVAAEEVAADEPGNGVAHLGKRS